MNETRLITIPLPLAAPDGAGDSDQPELDVHRHTRKLAESRGWVLVCDPSVPPGEFIHCAHGARLVVTPCGRYCALFAWTGSSLQSHFRFMIERAPPAWCVSKPTPCGEGIVVRFLKFRLPDMLAMGIVIPYHAKEGGSR